MDFTSSLLPLIGICPGRRFSNSSPAASPARRGTYHPHFDLPIKK